MKKQIIVSLQVEGLHCWPGCPIEEVNYLKTPHRHMFHIKLIKEVTHNNRDIEIIQMKHKAVKYFDLYKSIKHNCLDFGSRSCEDIAEELLNEFQLDCCEVLEDGENGALISK